MVITKQIPLIVIRHGSLMINNKNIEIFEEITKHLLLDSVPTLYLKSILEESNQIDYPLTMLMKMKNTKQSKKYHPEGNVLNHTMLVIEEAAKVRDKSKDSKVFMWAALLHDIGKPDTTRIKKDKITSYDHDKLGAKLAREFLEYYTEDNQFIESVVNLIKYHMHILYVVKDMKFGNIDALINEGDIEEIALLGWCDRMGRTGANPIEEKENIDLFKEKISRI